MKKLAYVIIGVFVLGLIAMVPTAIAQEDPLLFKYGVGGSPNTIDPANTWDSASFDIVSQTSEGLVGYNLTDPELGVVPKLATNTGTWSADGKNVTFTLRTDVTFHDGDPFNATAVKYTFERLNHLIYTNVSILGELYKPLAQLYPTTPFLINKVEVVDEFTAKFVLNYQYAAFTALLCFAGSFIVHYDAPLDRMIRLNETVIGTGPYVLESYSTAETHFTAYEDYYLAQPDIQEMIWILYDDDVAKNQALLAGDVAMIDGILPDYLDEYEANPIITVREPFAGATIGYMGMNNERIPKAMRQAISYAINYDYIINTIYNKQVIRMTSPIPKGILYHDETVTPPILNLTKAREILIAAGLNKGVTALDENDPWVELWNENPVASYNFSYNIGNKIRADLGLLISNNLQNIGVRVTVIGLTWPVYLEALQGEFDRLELYQIGWLPDYNDPSNYINPLFSNTSLSNGAQVNDPKLQTDMMDALNITDPVLRRAKYAEIQHYIVDDLCPWIFMTTPVSKTAYNKGIENWSRNVVGQRDYYSVKWAGMYTPTTGGPTIPGYSFLALVGAAAVTVGVLLYKRRR